MTIEQLFANLEDAKNGERKAFLAYVANSHPRTMSDWGNARHILYDRWLAYSVASNSMLG